MLQEAVGAEQALAILGGPKAVALPYPTWPALTLEDVEAAIHALRTEPISALTITETVDQLETAFENYHGRRFALAVNGGTSALDLAMLAAGVQPGDEVLVSTYVYGACVGCILHANAIPVFVDIDPDRFTIDPAEIERNVTPRTRAILAVHMFGHPCDMDPIMDIAERHGLAVIEDCAQAHGGLYKGRKVGSIGHIGCFSIGDGKHVTGGEGGILLTDDRRIYDRAILEGAHTLRHAEVETEDLQRYSDALGWNFRITHVAAAIARVQFQRLDRDNALRRAYLARLTEAIVEMPGIRPPRIPADSEPAFHFYAMTYLAEELGGLPRERFIEALKSEGVPIGAYVRVPVHLRPRIQEKSFYGRGCPWHCGCASRDVVYRAGDCPIAEARCASTELTMPVTPLALTPPEHVEQMIAAFRKVTSQADALRGG
jgi:dTDP-4-amino-4,6-dideoxygalactose transaminase